MLTDSNSPHNDLESLLRWRALPETQEVLKWLRDKAQPAFRLALAGPTEYRINSGGESGVIPDGSVIQQMRDQFIGNYQGLSALEKHLDFTEQALREIIQQQDNKAR